MDSVKNIMKNANKLLEKAVCQKDCLDVEFKSATLLSEQNKLQQLFNSKYSDAELARQKTICINAYIYLEYAMIPYDEEYRMDYYLRCEASDIYMKCRKHVSELSKKGGSNLTEFIDKCYKPASILNDNAKSSTNMMKKEDVESVKAFYNELVSV